ncbi:hypothetical protein ACN38_g2337 [Penicillium nordicum]|uniref:Uncharacterized protein n=1 Tax=Penicillium nordicum TaxID=229535 RepID=A0A0M8PE14_9EURO|nr:hypothetical protein ACN38_g2337 [Penicillium nordicum]
MLRLVQMHPQMGKPGIWDIQGQSLVDHQLNFYIVFTTWIWTSQRIKLDSEVGERKIMETNMFLQLLEYRAGAITWVFRCPTKFLHKCGTPRLLT